MYHYTRIGSFPVGSKVLDLGGAHRLLFNCRVRMNTRKLKVFRNSGLNCVECGLEGSLWVVEKQKVTSQPAKPVLNLYGIDKDGKEVMMTQDHIVSKAIGGTNKMENLQTMCFTCNSEKREFTEIPTDGYRYGSARKRIKDIVSGHRDCEQSKHVLYSKILGVLGDVYRLNDLPIIRELASEGDVDVTSDNETA